MSIPPELMQSNDSGDRSGAAGGKRQSPVEDWEMPGNGDMNGRSRDDLLVDLSKVEEEIRTLRQVLYAKETKANNLRRELGISPLQLMTKDVANSFKTIKDASGAAVLKVKESDSIQKINQSYAVQASKSAVSNAASYTKSGITSLGYGMKSSLEGLKDSRIGQSVSSLRSTVVGGPSRSTSGGLESEDSGLFSGGSTTPQIYTEPPAADNASA